MRCLGDTSCKSWSFSAGVYRMHEQPHQQQTTSIPSGSWSVVHLQIGPNFPSGRPGAASEVHQGGGSVSSHWLQIRRRTGVIPRHHDPRAWPADKDGSSPLWRRATCVDDPSMPRSAHTYCGDVTVLSSPPRSKHKPVKPAVAAVMSTASGSGETLNLNDPSLKLHGSEKSLKDVRTWTFSWQQQDAHPHGRSSRGLSLTVALLSAGLSMFVLLQSHPCRS